MHPILFRLGPWQARSYGVMLALSFVLGIALARRRARAEAIAPAHVMTIAFFVLIATLVGSRLAYVAVNPGEFAGNWLAIINPYQEGRLQLSGLVMNGGVLCAAAAAAAVIRFNKLPFWPMLDVLAPSLPLGEFLTRIGCLLNGCCYGRPTGLPWGLVFPADSAAGQFQRAQHAPAVPLHPAQVYSALCALGIFAALLWLERRYKKFAGFTTLALFLLYPAARFGLEFFRQYHDQVGVYGGLTHNQYLSLALFAASAAGMLLLSRQDRAAADNAGRHGQGSGLASKPGSLRP